MQFKKIYNLILVLAIAIILTACPQENPLLVEQPSQSNTIYLRFINLAGDKAPRTLSFEAKYEFVNVPYLTNTEAINPIGDSAFASVLFNNIVEKRSSYKTKFQSKTNYTFFGIPSSPRDTIQKLIDSIYFITTSFSKPSEIDYTFVRFANFVPDSIGAFSYSLGCPSGKTLASSLGYRGLTSNIEIPSGKFVFSVQYNKNGITELGTYEVTLNSSQSYNYLIFTALELDGSTGIYLLDEENKQINSMQKLASQTNKDAFVKIVNISSKSINLEYNLGKSLIPNISPNSISDFATIESCKLSEKDTLIISSNGGVLNKFVAALTVGQNYTLFVSDSVNGEISLLLNEEIKNKSISQGRTQVRVLNFLNNKTINVSLGARDTSGGGYTAGEIIAGEVRSYSSSPIQILKSGDAPISIFSTSPPVKYLFSAFQKFETNNNLNFIASTDDEGVNNYYLIDDAAKNISLKPLTEGVLMQFLNGVPDKDFVEINIANRFNNVRLPYSNVIATIVSQGTNNISVNGKSFNYNSTTDKRNLLVASGDASSIDLGDFTSLPMDSPPNFYKRRAANAAKDFGTLRVYDSDPNSSTGSTSPWSDELPYQTICDPRFMDNEKKLSYWFVNSDDITKTATKLNDIRLNYGKNYTFVFIGSKIGYTAVILQEY